MSAHAHLARTVKCAGLAVLVCGMAPAVLAQQTSPAASAICGGEQRIFSLGLNWYANVRFLADYQRVEVDRLSTGGAAFGASALTPPAGAQVGQDLNIWSFRTQYAF